VIAEDEDVRAKTGGGPRTAWRAVVGAALLTATATTVVAAGEAVRTDERPKAVIELFTSQGCANCPPADALLGTLSNDPRLVTLSFSVDYWDYLGWKDTAARPEFTKRQRAYAEARGDRSVYTPQVVINGRVHAVGSDRVAIERRLAALAAADETLDVPVDVETTPEALVIRVAAAGADERRRPTATVWLVHYERTRSVEIGRGENSGRTVTYSHLVRSMQPIGMWKGAALRLELPRREAARDPSGGCAVLVQTDDDGVPGAIIGARQISAPDS
jgi:hypothetical protein